MNIIIKLIVVLVIFQYPIRSMAQDYPTSGMMQYAIVQSVEANSLMPDVNPFGFDIGMHFQTNPYSPVYLGLSFGYQNYGSNRSHADIKTTHNIYNFNLNLRVNMHQSENLNIYVKGDLGLNLLNTRSFVGSNGLGTFGKNFVLAILSGEDDDTDYYELDVIHSFSSSAPNLGVALGIEMPLDYDNDFFFIEAGYRHLGNVELIEKQNVNIGYDYIEYGITDTQLSLLNFKIGLTHYF